MYFHNRKVLTFLVTLLIVEFTLELVASVKSAILTARSVFLAPLGLPWPGCFAFPNVEFTFMAWIPDAVIATIFFGMTLATLFRNGIWQPSDFKSMRRISPLVGSFIKDGAVFFFLILAVLLSDMFMNVLFHNSFANFLGGWLIAIYSFAATRLILNLRETSQLSLEDSVMLHTFTRRPEEPTIAFGERDEINCGAETTFELRERL